MPYYNFGSFERLVQMFSLPLGRFIWKFVNSAVISDMGVPADSPLIPGMLGLCDYLSHFLKNIRFKLITPLVLPQGITTSS